MPVHPSAARYRAHVDRGEQLRVARDGDQKERWHLAGLERLHPETFELLARDPDAGVRASLLLDNYRTPEHLVEQLAAESDEFAELARYHPNASCERMETGILGRHIPTAIQSYLDRNGATSDQRRELLAARNDDRRDETLGSVWERISNRT